jgi:hypothetical protein
MLGPGEREIRYEVLIERLLLREDASSRRPVCLSAMLPDGEELDDFVQGSTVEAFRGLVQSHRETIRAVMGARPSEKKQREGRRP